MLEKVTLQEKVLLEILEWGIKQGSKNLTKISPSKAASLGSMAIAETVEKTEIMRKTLQRRRRREDEVVDILPQCQSQ